MGIEATITKVVDACNKLTDTVTNQIGKINAQVDVVSNQFTAWRNSVQAKDINGRALYSQEIDLTGLPTDTFYPVWWTMPGNESGETEVTFSRIFSRNSESTPFGQGTFHIAGLNLQMEGCGHLWSGDGNYLTVKRISQTYRETVRGVSFGMICIARHVSGVRPLYLDVKDGQVIESSIHSGLYLRGGLSYTVNKSFPDAVSFSRLDTEVAMGESTQGDWEIRWCVRPYRLADVDAVLGATLPEKRMAYAYDNDKIYAMKGA
ncbi:phage tail protein [Pseudomonas sp. AMR01]|uniref:phage tail protein n=1 Tax=Pseudomonas sp. AMR01 TaxID=3064904 RepID=UPI0035C0A8BD